MGFNIFPAYRGYRRNDVSPRMDGLREMKDATEYLNRLSPKEREAVRLELKRLDRKFERLVKADPPAAQETRQERDACRRKLGLH